MNFNKKVIIILSFLMLISNSGFEINVGFCCKQIIKISLNDSYSNICHQTKKVVANCCTSEIANENCCSTKKIDVKSNTEYSIIKDIKISFKAVANNLSLQHFLSFVFEIQFPKSTLNYFDFQKSCNALFKIFCSYLTYG